jgi:DNA-binding beta-propeller fold protein YncE
VGSRSDGSVVTHTQETLLYRDAEGRTRSEITRDSQIMTYRDQQGNSRTMDVTQMYGGGKHSLTVADPVEGITFSWTIDEQSAKKQVRVDRSAPRPPKNPTQTTPAPVGSAPGGATVKPITNKVYVSNSNDGTVTVLSF